MKTYELFTGDELSIAEKIQQRRYQLLIHSCIYYHLDKNVITDAKWDAWAVELQNLQSSYPEISKQVALYEYFQDWDASTGTFLPITLPWVISTAMRVLTLNQGDVVDNIEKTVNKKKRLF